MNLGISTVKNCALAGALAVAMTTAAWGQAQAPGQLLRISRYKVKANATYDFGEGIKLINEAYKKSGVASRQAWTSSMFGETYLVVLVTPVKNFAQFDSPSPMAGMSTADNVKFQTLMRNAVESSHHSLIRQAPELSLASGTMQEPKRARVMNLTVKPGKVAEFEDALKTMLLPALKQAGIKDYWVSRTVLGGPMGAYTILTPFTNWAEMDGWASTEKLLGASYKAFLARIADSVDHAETMTASTSAEMSYRAQ